MPLCVAAPAVTLAAPPPFIQCSAARSNRMRLYGLLTAIACATPLVIGLRLTPDPSGIGTHRQLGLPACNFVPMTGLPCPTCGMTTAFAWMLHGHPLRSLLAQPLGALLCLASIGAVGMGAWMAATGRWIQVDWYRLSPGGLVVGLAGAFFLAWGFKIGYGLCTGALPYHP